MPPAEPDVVVVGGGPAGSATAIELASAGLQVVVVEARAAPAELFGETVPPGILVRLDRLGLSERFRADGHLACPGTVVRWGGDRLGHNDFIRDPLGPAWHLDRARFEQALRDRVEATGATVLTSTRLGGVDRAGRRWHVGLRDPGGELVLRARWLVDASGSRGCLARRAGARRAVLDRLVALVRIAQFPDGNLSAQTLVESSPDGWWYAARLPAGRLVTVLVTCAENVRPLTADGWSGWRRSLAGTHLLAERLAAVTLADRPETWRHLVRTVAVSRLEPAAGPGWLAVGDAAAELDPIAGRGIHDALLDSRNAARVVVGDLPASAYQRQLDERFDRHLAERSEHYGGERRWPTAPFWLARG